MKIEPTKSALQDACDLGDMCYVRNLGLDCAINFKAARQIHGARNFTICNGRQKFDIVVVSNVIFDFIVYLEFDELILKFLKINQKNK